LAGSEPRQGTDAARFPQSNDMIGCRTAWIGAIFRRHSPLFRRRRPYRAPAVGWGLRET